MGERPQTASFWSHLKLGPPDRIFGLLEACKADPRPEKVNLAIGTYVDTDDKPYVLKVVRKAEESLARKNLDKEYADILGIPAFRQATAELMLTKSCPFVQKKQVASAQTISGTGGLSTAAKFIASFHRHEKVVYLPNPTWPNHAPIFTAAGFECRQYTYYNSATRLFDSESTLKDLSEMAEGSVVLFQGCGHNPTGSDPTDEEWRNLSKLRKEKNLLVLFDMVYQGFGSGTLDGDAVGVRQFAKDKNNIIISYSYAKNMGLYGERTGCVLVLTSSAEEAVVVESQLKRIIRPLWSNPPVHGARIATEILTDPQLFEEWMTELKGMAQRIDSMRTAMTAALKRTGSKCDWSHIEKQRGWFAYTGLTSVQVQRMQDEFAVYMQKDGRLPLVKINPTNVGRVADAIHHVTK